MKTALPLLTIIVSFIAAPLGLADELEPLMTRPDELVLENDFSENAPLNRDHWSPRQATRWKIVDGVLRGQESTAENQAKKDHHKGLEPRISAPVTPAEFAMSFSVRFAEGEATPIVPFIEFGHHIVRVRFDAEAGAMLLVDYESLQVASAPDFRYQPGEWIHGLAELKGNEFVIQFLDGPTLYARHEVLGQAAPSGGTGFGLAGPRGGVAEIDNVRIWSVKPQLADGWAERRARFPKAQAIQVREKPQK